MNTQSSISSAPRRLGLVLTAVLGVCGLAGSGAAWAQSTVGMVFGKAPAGDTVSAVSTSTGVQREVHVASNGRYALRALPVGTYTITLQENGKPVLQHRNVPVVVGRGIKVDLDGAASKE